MSASEIEKSERKKSKGLKALVKSKSKTDLGIAKKSGESNKGLSKSSSLKEVKDKKSESKSVLESSSLKEFKTANFSQQGNGSRGRLQRQLSISKQDSDMELKTSRQLFKDDSHDSGIVLEMNTKSKQSLTGLDSQEDPREEIRENASKSKKGSTISKIVKTVKSSKSRTASSSSGDGTQQSGSSSEVKHSKSRSSSDKQAESKLFIKRREATQEDNKTVATVDRDVDPVYSLLKCAADLPRVGKVTCMYCNGHHSASKPCSPVDKCSSASQVPSSPSSELHGIVEQSLGSEFKQFYKLTSPTNKSNTPFDHLI